MRRAVVPPLRIDTIRPLFCLWITYNVQQSERGGGAERDMHMPKHTFMLRALHPDDTAALTDLITEFDGELTTHFLIDPYMAITAGTEERTLAVVAECGAYDGLVGMGTVRFGRMAFNGQVLPFAALDGLKVRAEFRGQGLGRQLAAWRVQQARDAYGDGCVIVTGLLRDNHASRAVATKWVSAHKRWVNCRSWQQQGGS